MIISCVWDEKLCMCLIVFDMCLSSIISGTLCVDYNLVIGEEMILDIIDK